MEVTIENIDGQEMTVILHKNYGMQDVVECLDECNYDILVDGTYIFFSGSIGGHKATALPPLPRRPKPEDAPLLYRYMAEGFALKWDSGSCISTTGKDGNKIEIAIKE